MIMKNRFSLYLLIIIQWASLQAQVSEENIDRSPTIPLITKYKIAKIAPYFYNPHFLGKWYLTALGTYQEKEIEPTSVESEKLSSPILSM